jgi:hypothetical protein
VALWKLNGIFGGSGLQPQFAYRALFSVFRGDLKNNKTPIFMLRFPAFSDIFISHLITQGANRER